MSKKWKNTNEFIGKSGDLLLTRRSERRYAERILFIIPFLLALATIFIIDNTLANGVVSGKYYWFYGSMGLASIATLIYSFTNKQSFRFSLADGFVLLFAGSVFLSSFIFNEASANTTKLTLLALLVVLYFCFRIIFQGTTGQACNERVVFICVFIIITGLVEAVWGLLQLYGFQPSQHSLFHLTGSFFNPGPYAGYLAVIFPLALHYALTPKSPKGDLAVCVCDLKAPFRGLDVITCIAIILVLPAAMSRASWLAAIAGSAVVVFKTEKIKIRVNQFHLRHLRAIALVITLLLVAGFIGIYFLKKDSADGRLLTWKVSLNVLVKHPLGVGLGHFPAAYGDAQAAYFASGKASEIEEHVAGNPEYGFNEFLQIAIESGIVSLLLFIGLLISAFRGLAKTKNWGVIGSLVALLVFACFSYPFSVLLFPIILVFLLAMSGVNSTQITQIERIDANKSLKSVLISLICVICVPIILYKQYPVYHAYKQWNNSKMYYQAGMYKEAAQDYEPLYPYLNDQIQFLFECGRSLSQAEQPEKSNEVLLHASQISCDPMLYNIIGKNYQVMKEYDLAENNLLKSTHIVPNRLYPYYLLMKLYIEMENEAKAREAARVVLTKEPKVQSQAVKEMREEAKKIMNYINLTQN